MPVFEESIAVVRKLAIQKAPDRDSSARNPPAIVVAVALFALDSNEFGVRTPRSEFRSNPLTLRDIHVVIACAMHREERNVRPCEAF